MYTLIMLQGFTSKLKDYDRITLGFREEQFLYMITLEEKSVNRIYSERNNGETDRGKARKLPDFRFTGDDSIAYKNVHKRVKRLEALGLVEQVKAITQGSKQKEIKYRVTSKGLFQLLQSRPSFNPRLYAVGAQPFILPLAYSDDIIFQQLIYQYFELETVRELTSIFGPIFFSDYL